MVETINTGALTAISRDLAQVVERTSRAVVRVDDGSRLTATGVVWSEDGVIVTTSHGVERDDEIKIETVAGEVVPAVLIGRDSDTDLAVLKVQATGLDPIGRAEADAARIGSLVLAVALPGRSGLHATLGIVTTRTDTQSSGRAEYLIHTDADMYPGFSGGALVDVEGNLLGLINLMFGRGHGIGLGTPAVANVVQALLTTGRVQRGYLGVRAQQVSLPEPISAALPWPQERALMVAQVEPGSPAHSAGLFLGDTILRLDETTIQNVDALRGELRLHAPGATVVIEYLRGGERRSAPVTLGAE